MCLVATSLELAWTNHDADAYDADFSLAALSRSFIRVEMDAVV